MTQHQVSTGAGVVLAGGPPGQHCCPAQPSPLCSARCQSWHQSRHIADTSDTSGPRAGLITCKKVKGPGLYDLIYHYILQYVWLGWLCRWCLVAVAVTSLSAHTVPGQAGTLHQWSQASGVAWSVPPLGSQHSASDFGSLYPIGFSRNILYDLFVLCCNI